MMATEGKEAAGLGKTAADLYASQGISGFYRGLEANVMRAMVSEFVFLFSLLIKRADLACLS